MKELLQRVQKARKEATYTFLKERTTHEFATFIRDAIVEIKLSMRSSGIPEDDIDDPNKIKSLIADSFRISFSEQLPQQKNSFMSNLSALLSRNDPFLHSRFIELARHFSKAHDLSIRSSNEKSLNKDPERYRRVDEHLEGMYQEAAYRGVRMENQITQEIEHGEIIPEVLILQGGGAKGFAYSGVAQHLHDRGILKNIKKVGGTSAGALMALPIALGYNPEEIQEIVQNGRYAQFFAESSHAFKFLTKIDSLTSKKPPKERAYVESNLLDEFARDYMSQSLEVHTGIPMSKWVKMNEQEAQRVISEMEIKGNLDTAYRVAVEVFNENLISNGRENEVGILDFGQMLSRSKAFNAAINTVRYLRSDKHSESELIEAFIGDVIQARIEKVPLEIRHAVEPALTTLESIRNINFDQLKQLSQLYPEGNFKEYGVAVTDSYAPLTPVNAIRYGKRLAENLLGRLTGDGPKDSGLGVFDKKRAMKPVFVRASNGTDDYVDMPIKKAVRASMNLPVVFKPMKHGLMRLVDGGLTNNFPHRLFRDSFDSAEEANSKTIGFMLSAIETDIEIKQLNELVRGSKPKLNIILEEEVSAFGLNHKEGKSNIFIRAKEAIMSRISSFIGNRVEDLMGFYNTSTPSVEDMDNVGIINTGLVGTADFHLSSSGRYDLHRAGVYSSINLNSLNSDKDLRFATGRLISLITIEQKLLDESVSENKADSPFAKVYDSDTMIATLEKVDYNTWDLSDVLMGRPLGKGAPQGVCLNNICFPDMA